MDARLTETQAHSFPELSLSPLFERRWCSLYEAFEDGQIDQNRLRQVFAKYLLQPVEGKQMWLGIDATSIERPQSKTSPDRTVVYKPNLEDEQQAHQLWLAVLDGRTPARAARSLMGNRPRTDGILLDERQAGGGQQPSSVQLAPAAATLGLSKPLIFAGPAFAAMPVEPTVGHYKYKVGSIEVTAVYDGIWRKPHDPAFIKGVSVEETKVALAKAGLTTDFMPIPLTVVVLKIGDKLIMVDAGSGVGQWQANATNLPANMKAAGIDHNEISTVLISHFHPDHVWGLMEKGTNAPTFANAELVTNSVEYKFWTEDGRVDKLPEGRKAAGRRIAENFPKWKNWKLVESGAEVAPGVRILDAYGHTPGHSVFLVTSGKDQLMVSNDTMYVPGILAPHPEWQGAYDQDGPLAVETRRRIIDRVIADRMQICGAHFPFPGAGTFVKDGAAYAFTPVLQS